MSTIDHPKHYGGAQDPYEAIKVIEAWGLGFCLGNTLKYISRAGKKDPAKFIEDLEKASWYLAREIQRMRDMQAHAKRLDREPEKFQQELEERPACTFEVGEPIQ